MISETIILIISIILLSLAYILTLIPKNPSIPFFKIVRKLHPISFIAAIGIPFLLI